MSVDQKSKARFSSGGPASVVVLSDDAIDFSSLIIPSGREHSKVEEYVNGITNLSTVNRGFLLKLIPLMDVYITAGDSEKQQKSGFFFNQCKHMAESHEGGKLPLYCAILWYILAVHGKTCAVESHNEDAGLDSSVYTQMQRLKAVVSCTRQALVPNIVNDGDDSYAQSMDKLVAEICPRPGFYPSFVGTQRLQISAEKQFDSLNMIFRQLAHDARFEDPTPALKAISTFMENPDSDAPYWHACEWIKLYARVFVAHETFKAEYWDLLAENIIAAGKKYENSKPMTVIHPVGYAWMVEAGKQALCKIAEVRSNATDLKEQLKKKQVLSESADREPDDLHWDDTNEKNKIQATFDELKSHLRFALQSKTTE
ncbi:hypothetical protein JX265_002237 [Neoarthrinium moseri]|uniref:Uncharacterized protein n=1 Tax=Neoarthrinium moseri TaxID=1658444 RepID=A0A9Q0AU41_9PEZI|nr:hypothetical protein JX265_002237 [Neoarthrinium moseri]